MKWTTKSFKLIFVYVPVSISHPSYILYHIYLYFTVIRFQLVCILYAGTFKTLVDHVTDHMDAPSHGLSIRQRCLVAVWYLANRGGYRYVPTAITLVLLSLKRSFAWYDWLLVF